uniref:Uncharacterized protein n=1 Tax=uncultured bacterium A1Q1_fos_2067 TaxID=1256560 RepID=L7VVP0_9BACT|nr:hypothetical protein [uncultured bacterium A1Q1_fos_2067]
MSGFKGGRSWCIGGVGSNWNLQGRHPARSEGRYEKNGGGWLD